ERLHLALAGEDQRVLVVLARDVHAALAPRDVAGDGVRLAQKAALAALLGERQRLADRDLGGLEVAPAQAALGQVQLPRRDTHVVLAALDGGFQQAAPLHGVAGQRARPA